MNRPEKFGCLTFKLKKEFTTGGELQNHEPLETLFDNYIKTLDELTVIQAEREIALENLRNLTSQLQVKRLRYNAKSACKYFTL